jgi:MFS family permease
MSSEATSNPGALLHLRSFLLLAVGQIVSILGSRLTSFALGVWIYQRTGSTTSFALMLLATSLPGVAFQPVAGVLVDRWDRRRSLIVGDSGSAVGTLLLLAVVSSGAELLWPIYAILALRAFFDAIQSPAMEATLPLLVPREHLGRANGLVDLGSEGTRILAPPIAGALLGVIGLSGLLAIDFGTFLVAVAKCKEMTQTADRLIKAVQVLGFQSPVKGSADVIHFTLDPSQTDLLVGIGK